MSKANAMMYHTFTSKGRKFQNSFLHLIFIYLNSARDFHPIGINFKVKIKCYGVPVPYYYYQNSIHYINPSVAPNLNYTWQ